MKTVYKLVDLNGFAEDLKGERWFFREGLTCTAPDNQEIFTFCTHPIYCFEAATYKRNRTADGCYVFKAVIDEKNAVMFDEKRGCTSEIHISGVLSDSELNAMLNNGIGNIGKLNTGSYNSGDRNIGNRNYGSQNTGSYNLGNFNLGDRNLGDWNVGTCNIGNENTGQYNFGFKHTGMFNIGVNKACNGYFNIDSESKYSIFNIPVKVSDYIKVSISEEIKQLEKILRVYSGVAANSIPFVENEDGVIRFKDFPAFKLESIFESVGISFDNAMFKKCLKEWVLHKRYVLALDLKTRKERRKNAT